MANEGKQIPRISHEPFKKTSWQNILYGNLNINSYCWLTVKFGLKL